MSLGWHRFLFWLCVAMAVFSVAAGVYLIAHGIRTWGPILFAAYWSFWAWQRAKLIGMLEAS